MELLAVKLEKKQNGITEVYAEKKILGSAAKNLARWYSHESLGQRTVVIVKDWRGSKSRTSRPGNAQVVLVLS